jgi:hypothetical protein
LPPPKTKRHSPPAKATRHAAAEAASKAASKGAKVAKVGKEEEEAAVGKAAKVAKVGKAEEEAAVVVEEGLEARLQEAVEALVEEASLAAEGEAQARVDAAAAVQAVVKGKGKAKEKAKPVPAVAPPSDAGLKARGEEQATMHVPRAPPRAPPRTPRPPPAARPLKDAPQADGGRSPRPTGWWENLPWEEGEAGATGEVRAAMTGGKAEERVVGLAQPGDTADAWARRVLHRARRADAAPHVILASGAANAQAIAAGIRRL